jgi:glutamyl-tRNA synthetase
VVKSPARLDFDKLNHFNQHYIGVADDGRLAGLVTEVLRSRDLHLPADLGGRLARTIPLVKEGAKTIPELADLTLFALRPSASALDGKARALFTGEVTARLVRLADWLAAANDWTPAALLERLKAFAEAEGGFGKFGPALRAILAAGAVAPDLASALAALGREESLARIADALSQVQ